MNLKPERLPPAYHEGFTAGACGKFQQNPYVKPSVPATWWEKGFQAARSKPELELPK